MQNREVHYVMATKAIHFLGDVSREKPDLAVIHGEEGNNWIGQWMFGLGLLNIQFPKETSRELTQEEKNYFNASHRIVNGGPPIPLNVGE